MPLFYQQNINEHTRLGVWHIQENESFFLESVPLQREITHPHKRLQHLAGRFLLRFLYEDFPLDLIRIADTRKPFLENELFHFSISHSGDYAAVIVSKYQRVGIDVECHTPNVLKVMKKFLRNDEVHLLEKRRKMIPYAYETLMWSIKESLFKWHGDGGVDFLQDLHIISIQGEINGTAACKFTGKLNQDLLVEYQIQKDHCLTWVCSDIL
ncbi:MAG: 4'-phosphopantetheinyl transferase family protein [Chitinophagaceae bacterium]